MLDYGFFCGKSKVHALKFRYQTTLRLEAKLAVSFDPLAAHRMGVRVLRRHAGNEGGMPGMPDLLAWACGVCRQALARDSRREAECLGQFRRGQRYARAPTLSCQPGICTCRGRHEGPTWPRRHPRNFRPLHAGPLPLPGPPLTCRQPASQISAHTFRNSLHQDLLQNGDCCSGRTISSIACLDVVKVGVVRWGGPVVLLQLSQQPLQLCVSE